MIPSLSEVPVGTIIAYVGPDPTAQQNINWFPCIGGTLNKNVYVELGNLLLETFGPMNGDLFALPNLQGQFLRGVDPWPSLVDPDGATRYQQGNPKNKVGAVVGSAQDDIFASHEHALTGDPVCWGSGPDIAEVAIVLVAAQGSQPAAETRHDQRTSMSII